MYENMSDSCCAGNSHKKGIEFEVKKITRTDVFHLLLCGYIPPDLQLLFCFGFFFLHRTSFIRRKSMKMAACLCPSLKVPFLSVLSAQRHLLVVWRKNKKDSEHAWRQTSFPPASMYKLNIESNSHQSILTITSLVCQFTHSWVLDGNPFVTSQRATSAPSRWHLHLFATVFVDSPRMHQI